MPLRLGKTLALLPSALEKIETVFTQEQSAQFEWSFELRNLNDHLNCAIWMIISNDGILDRVYAKEQSAQFDGILDRVYAKEQSAQFEWSFQRQYFGPCIRQITSRCVIWNAQFKRRSGGVFQLRISQIMQRNRRMNALTSKLWFRGRSYVTF